jgi:putative transposase
MSNTVISDDRRASAKRPIPCNKLADKERQDIIDICNDPEFADVTPNQIVPTLVDRGLYLASQATFYRVLKDHNQLTSRTRFRPKGHHKKSLAQKATSPNCVWTWVISYLPSHVKGRHCYLYMIMGIFSRKIVGAEVYAQELGEHAADLLQRTT